MTARRYLITGATGGLGVAVMHGLAEQCHEVFVIGRNVARLHNRLGASRCIEASLAEPSHLIDAARTHGPWDGVVHCAGSEVLAPLRAPHAMNAWDTGMLAAESAYALLHAAARKGTMADGGSIVLMSSVAAHRGTPGMAAYSAGKAAIEAMARCAALELAPRGIRVNCVAAGAFVSPMHERITEGMTEDGVRAYAAKHPLGFGTANEVRDAVLWLLGDQARWVTGTTLTVDGGMLA